MRKPILALSLVALLVPLATACGDDDLPVVVDAAAPDSSGPPIPTGTSTSTSTPDAGDGGGGPELFTDFVKDIVARDTAPTTLPRAINGKTFAPDPEDPRAVPAAFFQ
jgi:hypothetical protein